MKAVQKAGGGGMANAGFSLLLGTAPGDTELHAEELCEDKMVAGFSKSLKRVWKMDLAEGLEARRSVQRSWDETG